MAGWSHGAGQSMVSFPRDVLQNIALCVGSPVQHVYATDKAFAARKANGSVVTWGSAAHGGDCSQVQQQLQDVTAIYANRTCFAAVKADHTVVTWGDAEFGARQPAWTQDLLVDVRTICATEDAFAALTAHGRSVLSWGAYYGGGGRRFNLPACIPITAIYSHTRGSLFTATTHDTIFIWGSQPGVEHRVDSHIEAGVVVQSVTHNLHAFAALNLDGTVVSWGTGHLGGDSSAVQPQLVHVQHIYATDDAFAALKKDGSVVQWGGGPWFAALQDPRHGWHMAPSRPLVDVQSISSTRHSFAALKADGSVIAWGPSAVPPHLTPDIQAELVEVKHIYASCNAFAALKHDGTVVAWGARDAGGDCSEVQAQLVNVQAIFATIMSFTSHGGFAALKADGTVVAWGALPLQLSNHRAHIQAQLVDVRTICPAQCGFAALKKNGSVVAWGMGGWGTRGQLGDWVLHPQWPLVAVCTAFR